MIYVLSIESVDDYRFQKKMIKLTGVMEQCENYKKLEPQFTLHIGELIEYCRESLRGKIRNTSIDGMSSTSRTSVFTGLGYDGGIFN